MTVRDLIVELRKYNPEFRVLAFDEQGNLANPIVTTDTDPSTTRNILIIEGDV